MPLDEMHCDVLFTVALGGLLARRLIINLIKCLVLYFSENTGDRGTSSVEKTARQIQNVGHYTRQLTTAFFKKAMPFKRKKR